MSITARYVGYQVVVGRSPAELAARVIVPLTEGWEPAGGVASAVALEGSAIAPQGARPVPLLVQALVLPAASAAGRAVLAEVAAARARPAEPSGKEN